MVGSRCCFPWSLNHSPSTIHPRTAERPMFDLLSPPLQDSSLSFCVAAAYRLYCMRAWASSSSLSHVVSSVTRKSKSLLFFLGTAVWYHTSTYNIQSVGPFDVLSCQSVSAPSRIFPICITPPVGACISRRLWSIIFPILLSFSFLFASTLLLSHFKFTSLVLSVLKKYLFLLAPTAPSALHRQGRGQRLRVLIHDQDWDQGGVCSRVWTPDKGSTTDRRWGWTRAAGLTPPVSRRQGVAPTRTRRRVRAKALAGGSNPRKTPAIATATATRIQATVEVCSTDSERRRAAKASKTLVRVAPPMLAACVRAAACNPPPSCSRGEPRNTGQTSGRDPPRPCPCPWPCSQEPARDKGLRFAAVRRTTRQALSAGKVCSVGRTYLVVMVWSWEIPTRKVGEERGKNLGQGQASGL